MSKLISLIRSEPAVIGYAVTAVLTAVITFGCRATPGQAAAVATIAVAVVTIITAFTTRPVTIPVVTGAVATIATAGGAFGLHLTTDQIGAAVPLLSIILALVLRQNVAPAAGRRAGSDPAG